MITNCLKDKIMKRNLRISERIKALEIGEAVSFPIPEYNYSSIGPTCRRIGIVTGKTFTTELNNRDSKKRMVTVVRIK